MDDESRPARRRKWLETSGLAAWQQMAIIRETESRLSRYVADGQIAGTSHQSVGMEAIAVGVSANLGRSDRIVSTHRGHAHCIAKGVPVTALLAELFGRASGLCGGKGGSMLLAMQEVGVLATSAIVGESIGIATGAALADSLGDSGNVVVCYFGDGALNEGIFHESLNLAAIWKLPCVYVCENNQYAKSCSVREMFAITDLVRRAESYGMPGIDVDGMDAFAVWESSRVAVETARAGLGPTLIMADSYRFCGHSTGDTEIYRSLDEKTSWHSRDPMSLLEGELIRTGLTTADALQDVRVETSLMIDMCEADAMAAPFPATEVAHRDVYGKVYQP